MGGYDTGPSVGLHPGSDGEMGRDDEAESTLRTGEYPPLGGCTGIMPEDATDGNMHTGALEGSGFGSGGGNFMQLILE